MPNEVTLPAVDAKAVLAVLNDARRRIEARKPPKARAQKEAARKRRELDLLAVNAAIRILADAIPEPDPDTATLENEAAARDRMADAPLETAAERIRRLRNAPWTPEGRLRPEYRRAHVPEGKRLSERDAHAEAVDWDAAELACVRARVAEKDDGDAFRYPPQGDRA